MTESLLMHLPIAGDIARVSVEIDNAVVCHYWILEVRPLYERRRLTACGASMFRRFSPDAWRRSALPTFCRERHSAQNVLWMESCKTVGVFPSTDFANSLTSWIFV